MNRGVVRNGEKGREGRVWEEGDIAGERKQ